MAKTVSASLCELCQKVYKSEQEALDCERWHKSADELKFVQASYDIDTSVHGFPHTLVIEALDGSGNRATYRWYSETQQKEKEESEKLNDAVRLEAKKVSKK